MTTIAFSPSTRRMDGKGLRNRGRGAMGSTVIFIWNLMRVHMLIVELVMNTDYDTH